MFDQETSEDQLYDKLHSWAKTFSNVQFIRDHQNGPRPQDKYGVLNLISAQHVSDVACGVYEEIDDEGTVRWVEYKGQEWEWMFSFQLFGKNTLDLCRQLLNSLENHTVLLDYLHPLKIRQKSLIRRLPVLVEEVFEERSQFDLTVAGITLDGAFIDVIDQSQISVGELEVTTSPDEEEGLIVTDECIPSHQIFLSRNT